MKINKWLFSAFLLSMAFYLSSCCTQMECGGVDDISSIALEGFDTADLGTVYLLQDNDTLDVQLDNRADSLQVLYLNQSISIFYTYTLYVANINKSYVIDNFKTKRERCNKGFMCRDFFRILTSYDVNGVNYPGSSQLKVFK